MAALIAAVVKAKVTLVEKHEMGGDCLNTGCVPSKALIKTARVLAQMKRAKEYGLQSAVAEFDFGEVMERVQRVVKTIEPHDSVERFTQLGVECVMGEARMVSPWEVEIRRADGATQRLTTRSIVIAAGAAPFVPPIHGLDQVGYLTSDTLWGLRKLPGRLVVLGGGPIGCELAQAFARFGSKVTQVEMLPRLMIREDPEVSGLVAKKFRAEGIDVLTEHKAKAFLLEEGRKVLVCEHAGADLRIEFDEVLVAVGRVPRGGPALLEKYLGAGAATWVRRLAPGAPAWANVHFLRDFARKPEPLDRRAHLLGWVWATLAGQHSAALTVADAGRRRFGGGRFEEMTAASGRSLRRAMVRGVPAMVWRRLTRG